MDRREHVDRTSIRDVGLDLVRGRDYGVRRNLVQYLVLDGLVSSGRRNDEATRKRSESPLAAVPQRGDEYERTRDRGDQIPANRVEALAESRYPSHAIGRDRKS